MCLEKYSPQRAHTHAHTAVHTHAKLHAHFHIQQTQECNVSLIETMM